MTCIVGLVDDGIVHIGADSAGVGGYSLTIRKDPKLFRNGDMLFGATSSFRMIQLLRFSLVLPAYDPATDLERYMAVDFVNAVRECLKNGGYAEKKNEQEEGGTFLVGFRGRLFQVEADYQVGEALCGYDACGCGHDIAKGALYATPDIQPKKRLEFALRAAEEHSAGVRGPFHIETLETQKEHEL